ncbi:alpha/beta hydrolase [Emticicia sp. SJ17W-69]|uniref:alpha/beta hydrolase n=1 Tax=Emticicia sp. SJ17W-69 TaxID=3421657 RepID=UPI003EBF1374
MKKILKKILYVIIAFVAIISIVGLILAYLPTESRTHHVGVSPEEAANLRQKYTAPHHLITTSDGETLFLRRWNPDSINPAKKDIAVLIFHGITAYSGPYDMAGKPISAGGYTTFGIDYRGHGLSGGNRGDSPGKERWIEDLAESVKYIKGLGFTKVVVLGHSLGVASAICAANAVPDEIAGLVLLSGAYEGRKGLSKPPTFFQTAKIFASSVFRPSFQAVEYYREGMTVTKDPLFNFRYTLRFLTMLDVKKLRLPASLNIPVLVGIGDKDELFEIDKVKDFYNLIPGNKKEFLIMKNTTHAKIPLESWQQVVVWLDKTYH